MTPLLGAVQHYAWGSDTAIPAAIGSVPDGRPWAELWWGTHPGATTLAITDGADGAGPVPLTDIAGPLPFLVKLLAADQPLSLQAHPSTAQAATGFASEERLGVPISAAERVYRDPSGKPEMLVAVTSFEALCGFRPTEEVALELEEGGAATVARHLRAHGPVATAGWLLRERPILTVRHPLFERLSVAYPGDPGVIVALLLRHLRLAPGEAVSVPAGVLHMYLHGVGLEVMGASDNVVRGGLTPKHVDIAELVSILDPAAPAPTAQRPGADGWYSAGTDVFAVQALGAADEWVASGPEIAVRLSGDGGTMAWYVPAGDRVEWPGGLGCRVTSGVSPHRG